MAVRVPTENLPWPGIHATRKRIDQLTAQLDEAYAERAILMKQMAEAGMGQREIGGYWGVSQVAVHFTLSGKPRKATR